MSAGVITERICTGICGEVKPLKCFGVQRRGTYGRRTMCHECYNKANKHWNRKRLYGIDSKVYETLLEEQNYKCGICGESSDNEDLCVDHIQVGAEIKIRGLLCKKCNRGLGKLGDISEVVLTRALDYLKGCLTIENESPQPVANAVEGKKCTKCGFVKSLEDFYKSKIGVCGRKPRCKFCTKTDEQVRLYCITEEKLSNLYKISGNRCFICQSLSDLCVDHDHRTGTVRGLLCQECNMGLGIFNDSVELMASAHRYIKG